MNRRDFLAGMAALPALTCLKTEARPSRRHVVEMQLGGWVAGGISYELPHTFLVSFTSTFRDETILFCAHKQTGVETMVWIDEQTVLFRGRPMRLARRPTYRQRWCCFPVVTKDLVEYC